LKAVNGTLHGPFGRIDLYQDGQRVGQLSWVPDFGPAEQWVSNGEEGYGKCHGSPQAAVKQVIADHKKHGKRDRRKKLFAIELQFDKDLALTRQEQDELFRQAEAFLVDVLYAYRKELSPKGAKLKTVRVHDLGRTA
jgi:hypothetical protein